MAMIGQSSFRRILLLRILLLSIPILFLGMAVTFRKARSSLLDTARVNLSQSAVQKAESIQSSIHALQVGLSVASETAALQFGSPVVSKLFLEQLQQQFENQIRTQIHCLQLRNLDTGELIASTCGDQRFDPVSTSSWPRQRTLTDPNRLRVHTLTLNQINPPPQEPMDSQLNLLISTPVYNTTGQLEYSLTAQTTIDQSGSSKPWLLQGETIVVGQDGTFLAHPVPERVGKNINQEPARDRYQNILNNVLGKGEPGGEGFRHLFNLTDDDATEWLAGFTSLVVPVTATETQTWAVLAATRTDNALQGLQEITRILLISTVGLLAAHLLAMLYMARDLALPLEQLGKYAQRIHKRNPQERAPKNFRVRELNHLAEVLDNMVGRLEERARELESAWQEAKAANQLKSEFLANTSHELRTPLNAIIGCIRLVKDGCCDSREEEEEFLEQADKAAIHLLQIINDLLDIQRIEEEKLPLSIQTVDLRQILKEVVDLEVVQIQQKGLQLNVTNVTEPILVQADPARLKQVLINIIYNAIKFTDQGSITVETRVQPAKEVFTPVGQNGYRLDLDEGAESDPWVVVSVKDTGIGIDPAQQHKLFRPFVMVDGTTTRKHEGTGLGLAISRNLVEMMGGQIALQSAGLGQGTTVSIALPVVEPESAAPPETRTETIQPVIESSPIG
ncbi:MAG: sensor histidine kinase [Synechococcales cyanobacterium C42_A2020_086]|nr:sensor histidine kinase [Synechococcales cyanobacterium C42_A2020_086]